MPKRDKGKAKRRWRYDFDRAVRKCAEAVIRAARDRAAATLDGRDLNDLVKNEMRRILGVKP